MILLLQEHCYKTANKKPSGKINEHLAACQDN